MPTWSHGRVAPAGDAAHATSSLSGQGSNVSLVGAYVLAGELAIHAHHRDAFTAYEQRLRRFAERNQALVTNGGTVVMPATQEDLDARNAVLRDPEAMARATASAEKGGSAHSGLALSDHADALGQGWCLEATAQRGAHEPESAVWRSNARACLSDR